MTDESNIGWIFGLICVLLTLTPWIGFDLWLKRHHHEYITTEVRELLQGGGWLPIAFMAFVGAVLAIAAYHFFYQRQI